MKFGKFWLISQTVFLFSTIWAKADEVQWTQEALNQSLRQEAIAGVIPRIEGLIQRGADINSKALYGECALEYSIRFGRLGAALRLIQLGADPNSEDASGMTPLLRASTYPNASRVVDALLKAGADVNHHDLYGRTALMNAAKSDSVRIVAVILSRALNTVDIDAQNDFQQSAASLAKDDLIQYMLETARKHRSGELPPPQLQ